VNFNIDTTIVVGFLLVNLAVGLYYGKKIKTIKDYALGNRSFSTAALVATIVATFITR
jgi:Na+/proline symporter